jgi:hypothetical protein|tara:strand:+ start:6873 stop:7373 length:501 start_codon:yes stop_codon:yes gene_type:complete
MTTFPSISPTARTYAPGNVPAVLQTALDGTTVGFKRGARRVNQVLSLSFSHLTEANMVLIKDHYIARKGTFEIFYLPSVIWGDYTTSPVGLDYAWRYSEAPQIEDVSFDRFTVSVELETISINTGDLRIDGENANPNTPERLYNIDAGSASATPARSHLINSGLAA